MSPGGLNLRPFLFSSPASFMQNAALSLVPKIDLLAEAVPESSLTARRGLPQGGHVLTGTLKRSPSPLPISTSLKCHRESSKVPLPNPRALPPSYTAQLLPGPFPCQASFSIKEKALISSWYEDFQFQLVFCWCQQVCWAASFSRSSRASCTPFLMS